MITTQCAGMWLCVTHGGSLAVEIIRIGLSNRVKGERMA